MDRMLYIAMSGAKETMYAQAVNTHNLANANTNGFRADLEAFVSKPVYGPGYASRAYILDQGQGVDFKPGPLVSTGRPLDVAVNGDGWLTIQAPDGSEAYSRAGDLHVDSLGRLMTGSGHPVMGNGGPIAVPPYEKLEIGNDGTISIRPLGQGPETMAAVDRIKLINPPLEQLTKGKDGFIRTVDGVPADPDARVSLVTGTLESSNVNSVEAMVNLIEAQRHFEMQVKVMKKADENEQATAELMRMS